MSIKKIEDKKHAVSKKKAICIGILVIAIAILTGYLTVVLSDRNQQVDVNGAPVVEIQTSYLTVWYPEKYKQHLKHEEIRSGADSVTVFSMVYEEIETELFRLSFTAEAPEEHAGYFAVDGAELYVSIKPSGFDAGIFSKDHTEDDLGAMEKIQSLYYSMLDGMTTVMDSVRRDERFSEVRGISEHGKQEQKLSYWTVSIPAEITCVETEQDGVYHATFIGNVGDKAIELYTISLGATNAQAIVGVYTTNGKSRPISVEPHYIDVDALSSEELELAYVMMDTLNDVLQVIRQDKHFSDQLEPVH